MNMTQASGRLAHRIREGQKSSRPTMQLVLGLNNGFGSEVGVQYCPYVGMLNVLGTKRQGQRSSGSHIYIALHLCHWRVRIG